jgi:hypothetical protein
MVDHIELGDSIHGERSSSISRVGNLIAPTSVGIGALRT